MAVKHITRGDGVLYLFGQPVGYLSGGVTIALEMSTEKFQAGVPARTITQVPVGANFTLRAGIAEIMGSNMGRAMGQQAASNLTAGTVNVTTPVNKIFQLDPSSGKELLQVGPGMGIAQNFTFVVLKSANGVTTYTAGTDYVLDAVNGWVERKAGGAIGSLAEIQIFSYSYEKIVGQKVDIGFEQELRDVPLCFVHTNPKSKKRTFAVMHKAQSDGSFSMDFTADDWLKTDVTWEALEDATRTDDSLGYVVIEEEEEVAPDVTPPTLESVVPADEATGVALDANIVFTFSEALLPSTVTAGNFLVLGPSGYIAGALSLSAGNTVVTFNPTSNFTAEAEYRWTVTDVADAAGNVMSGIQTGTFTAAS